MSDLFPIVENFNIKDNKLNMDLFIQNEIMYFKGHFPDFPLIPGVVQIHWVIKWIEKYFEDCNQFLKSPSVKFANPIMPNTKIKVVIEKDLNTLSKYSFSFYDIHRNISYSSGNIILKDLSNV